MYPSNKRGSVGSTSLLCIFEPSLSEVNYSQGR
jgi:hypothetical protein